MLSRFIRVRLRKEFIHKYPGAPEEVAFLRERHRHELHITVTLSVEHNNRDLEFIMVKRSLERYLDFKLPFLPEETSCEDVAELLINCCKDYYGSDRSIAVEVTEDGENGAILNWEEDQ